MRILSVDFDYFVDTTIEVRELNFPDGHDNFSPALTKFVWDRCYDFYEGLKDIKLIPEYEKMCEFFENLKGGRVLFADSHKEIEKFFSEVKPDEDLELIHIDFHHDMYVTGGETLDCGNWLRFLADKKPDLKVTWVKREDSDVESLSGEFPYDSTTDFSVVQGEFDLIFVCFSSPWTPPHLFDDYINMCLKLDHLDSF